MIGRWLYEKRNDAEAWCYRWYDVQPFAWLGRLIERRFRFLDRYRPPPGPPITVEELNRLLGEIYGPVYQLTTQTNTSLQEQFKAE